MRVLVCGGRTFDDGRRLHDVLSRMHADHVFSIVIEGDARGADRLAGQWARKRGVGNLKFPANWETHGRAAGPIRNKQMLDEGNPDLVIAFPGGRGTANMVRQARAAGVEVIEIAGAG